MKAFSLSLDSFDQPSRDWYAAVGMMAVYWTTLEVNLVPILNLVTLWVPEDEKPKSLGLLTFNRQIKLWNDAVHKGEFSDEFKKETLTLTKRLSTARTRRDLLMHGLTYEQQGKFYAVMFNSRKARKPKVPQHVPVPTAKLLKHASETRAITPDLFGYLAAAARELQDSLLRKHPELASIPSIRRTLANADKP